MVKGFFIYTGGPHRHCIIFQTYLHRLASVWNKPSCIFIVWCHLLEVTCTVYPSMSRFVISHTCQRYILALCLLHWVHTLHIRYVTCFSALMCWYLEHKYLFLGIALFFPCVCEPLTWYSSIGLQSCFYHFQHLNMIKMWLGITQGEQGFQI